jgi:hypothetical protein
MQASITRTCEITVLPFFLKKEGWDTSILQVFQQYFASRPDMKLLVDLMNM